MNVDSANRVAIPLPKDSQLAAGGGDNKTALLAPLRTHPTIRKSAAGL